MEFLDGEELRYVLKREKVLPPERMVRMLSQVAIGLDEAHARSFIHRDLKPDNLFLCGTREGDIVKLLDFGIGQGHRAGHRKKLTVLGTTIGSPYYMAPEQAQGLDTIDARADVFALAAVIYECITGSVPFAGNNGPSILLAILTKDPVPPSVKAAEAKYPIAAGARRRDRRGAGEEPEHPHQDASAPSRTPLVARTGSRATTWQWATTPQAELAQKIQESLARIMAAKPAFDVAADPFAAAPVPTTLPMAQPGPDLRQGMDRGFQDGGSDGGFEAAGLPSAKPGWLLPVVVGLLALVLGGAVTLVVMMH